VRALASIQKIVTIAPMRDAENIVSITVLNYHCVAGKDDFLPGGIVVYIETDSVLPERPEFEFLRTRYFIDKNGFKGFHIRTIRLRGMISQGICFPLSILPPGDYCEGQDVSDIIGVLKYEPPIPEHLKAVMKGAIPRYIPKTDETRIQGTKDVLEKHRGKWFSRTEKLDGESTTYSERDGEFIVCSRGINLQPTATNVYWRIARKLDIEKKLANQNLAIQGEIVGPGIRKNKYKLQDNRFFVHGIYSLDENRYLNYNEMITKTWELELDMVPILGIMQLSHTSDALVEMANGPSAINPHVLREGLVFRAVIEDTDQELGRLSFKVISPQFLLKHGE
jgi:RNA ligase (TIGR02306 family)